MPRDTPDAADVRRGKEQQMIPIKTLTDDERRFFERAAIHMKDGKSFAEAARAVVADDAPRRDRFRRHVSGRARLPQRTMESQAQQSIILPQELAAQAA